jgi:hypothetical protein
MSQDEHSVESSSDKEDNDKTQDLVRVKKNIFLYDKKCRTVLHLGVLYKNLSKSVANAINLDKITSKIQSMIDKNQIYLRDAGPIILGITKIIIKKTILLFEDIEQLTKLRINSKAQNSINNKGTLQNDEEEKDISKKDEKIDGKKLLPNEMKSSDGTSAININSFDDDNFNFKNSTLLDIESTMKKNKKLNNKFTDLTFSKDIIELNNDDMIRRTMQKMSKINEGDIKDIYSTNKKGSKKYNIDFNTDEKDNKALNNLREMLFNKKDGTSNNLLSNNFDNNEKDVEGFFTVIKSQIQTNNENEGELNDGTNLIDFNFEINANDLKDSNYVQNIKYEIDKDDPIADTLKSKDMSKSFFMQKGKLKYDEDIEIEMTDEETTDKSRKELEKKMEKENQSKLENIQYSFDLFNFDKSKLTSFDNEKYEYLLPKFLEADENTPNETESELRSLRNEDSRDSSTTKMNLVNNGTEEKNKNDITRANRLTTSNKKKISLANFDTENKVLMHNLSRMTLDKNDFKGATSFIEKMKAVDKETNLDDNREDNYDNSNVMDINLNNQDEPNETKSKKDKKYITEEIKEDEDVVLLKEDLTKNVFNNKKNKNISFNKIRDKLENGDKFEEQKLFYDLLLLAQKGDLEMTQDKLMDNDSINICLK